MYSRTTQLGDVDLNPFDWDWSSLLNNASAITKTVANTASAANTGIQKTRAAALGQSIPTPVIIGGIVAVGGVLWLLGQNHASSHRR